MQRTRSAARAWLTEGYREYPPPLDAAHAIECLWTSISTQRQVVRVDPDGCVDLLLRCSVSAHAYSAPFDSHVSLVGAMSHSRVISIHEGDVHVGVRFRPGHASRILTAPLNSCTDQVVPLSDKAHATTRQLVTNLLTADHPDAFGLLLTSLARSSQRADVVQQALDALTDSHGLLALDACGDIAVLGERQFRRVCLERTGLSPKRLARVLRFRRLTALLHTTKVPSMSALAAQFAYSDQAHMIRDVRALSGQTPVAFLAAAANDRFLQDGSPPVH